MRHTYIHVLFIALLASAACGDAAVAPADDAVDTATVEIGDDTKADGFDEVRVRAAEMTIWADPVVEPRSGGDWALSARSSYNLVEASATVAGEPVEAAAVSDRRFEVYLDAEPLVATLEGTPLLVELTTTSGRVRTAMFTTRARVAYSSGSSRIYPWKNLPPVIVGGHTVFRGRLTTRGTFDTAYGYNDDDSEPVMRREDATHWIADFPAYALPWAAHPTVDPVYFVVTGDDGTRYTRRVHLGVELATVGVTSDDPATAWPTPTCTDEVRACVQTLGVASDLEQCGSATEVRPCLDETPTDDSGADLQRKQAFADGLRQTLIDFYRDQEADVVASGGNPRTEALRSVDTAAMVELTSDEDVPSGHSLATHRVLTHPDTVFPGSDRIWYGVFDRGDDSLVDVFAFN